MSNFMTNQDGLSRDPRLRGLNERRMSAVQSPSPKSGQSPSPRNPSNPSVNYKKDAIRLRGERDRYQKEAHESRALIAALKEEILEINEKIADITRNTAAKDAQWLAKCEELAARKAEKDKQLQFCIRDLDREKKNTATLSLELDKERKAREECQQLLSQEERACHSASTELTKAQAKASKLSQEVKSKNQKIAYLQKQLTNDPDKVNELESVVAQLKASNDQLIGQIAANKSSFHSQMTAQKRSANYYKRTADEVRRKLARNEYLRKKDAVIRRKEIKKICQKERTSSDQLFDVLSKRVMIVIKNVTEQHKRTNSANLLDVVKESNKEKRQVEENSQRILETDRDGKVQCPECEFQLTCTRTLDMHLKSAHGLTVSEVIDIDIDSD